MLVSLLRLVEPAGGRIDIDGFDISKFGLTDLRSKMGIIPQDPVVFAGTLRENLDPCDLHTDSEVWEAARRAHLASYINTLPLGLQSEVETGGKNMSTGQRQLLCLARALLRKSKILLLDEATSSVDPNTDRLIQETIRNEFGDSTILTIAHRINTILDYDRVLVLANGEVKEFDSPKKLFDKPTSAFKQMCIDSGIFTFPYGDKQDI